MANLNSNNKDSPLKTDVSTILSQWQTCVEMANLTSQRRDAMNNLFATLNIALIAATSIVWDLKSIVMAVGGIILCLVWIAFVKYFRNLSEAKYDVITALEKKLPEQPFIVLYIAVVLVMVILKSKEV